MVVTRFSVYLVPLDPVVGSEMGKTRPCAIVSPDVMNRLVRTVVIAPLTTSQRHYPFRIQCLFDGKPGQVALDHLRVVDKSRLLKYLGKLDPTTANNVADILVEMFQ